MEKAHTSTVQKVKYNYSKVILAVWHSRGTSYCVHRIDTNLASIYSMQQKIKIKSVDIMSLKTYMKNWISEGVIQPSQHSTA